MPGVSPSKTGSAPQAFSFIFVGQASTPAAGLQTRFWCLKIFLWLTCSVLFALLPVAVNYINGRANGRPPGGIDLLSGGELFLIRPLLQPRHRKSVPGWEAFRVLRVVCGVSCALLLIVASIYFGRIAFSMEEHRTRLAAAIEARKPDLALQRLRDRWWTGLPSLKTRSRLVLAVCVHRDMRARSYTC
jgi:MFS family permease